MAQPDTPPNPARAWFILALSLAALCAMVRLPGLLALPIFGDEAIYLRWAQLVHDGHPWVSLCDPKPPLHFWLLAPLLNLGDPLQAGRLLSVIAAILSIPVTLALADELHYLSRSWWNQTIKAYSPLPSARAVGILTVILMIFCPFLAFYQRMALAESLFILEMLLIAWLSLRWARTTLSNNSAWPTAIALGIAFAAAMLTRQGVSYVLWAMPIGAFFLHLTNRLNPAPKNALPRAILTCLLAALVAAILWSPFLLAHLQTKAAENGGLVAELKRRILYQSSFTDVRETHVQIASRNFLLAFRPRTEDGVPKAGWLFYYLTPAIFISSFLGLILLAIRRQWRLLAFLLLWLALMLVFPLVMLSTLYSRYLLAGAVPLLIAAAYALAECLAWLLSRRAPAALLWLATFAIFAGLLVAPLREIGLQSTRWDRQTMVGHDAYQYLTGWTSGGPSQLAVETLRQLAAKQPITVITDDGWGNPADAAWLYLAHNPNVTLYYTPHDNQGVILQPSPNNPNAFRLRKDKWLFTPEQPVELPPNQPVYYITNDPIHRNEGDIPADDYFRQKNPNLGPGISFEGRAAGGEHVVVFPLQWNDQPATQESPRE